MQHFPAVLSLEESTALIARIEKHFEDRGFGLWALERRGDGAFLGFTGMTKVQFSSPIQGQVEIGWRLARELWGQGFATEAARACLWYGFEVLGLGQIVSMTVQSNRRSWTVMERLGMARASELDFSHPNLPPEHPLRRHIVYRMKREQWLGRTEARVGPLLR